MLKIIVLLAISILFQTYLYGGPTDNAQIFKDKDDGYSQCVNKGREYLLKCARDRSIYDNFISECKTTPPSKHTYNIFISYFLIRALTETGGIDNQNHALFMEILRSAKKGEVYAYSYTSPPDADDTAFAYRSLKILGDNARPEILKASLSGFYINGIWKTFFTKKTFPKDRFVVQYEDDISTYGIHPEVNINILLAFQELGQNVDVQMLHIMPKRTGLYQSYHYPSLFYATWMAAELLRKRGALVVEYDEIIRDMQKNGIWIGKEDEWTSAQETALALLIVSEKSIDAAWVKNGYRSLMIMQQSDGGWPSGVLWKYVVPGTKGTCIWKSYDIFRIVSTSLALLALKRRG